MFSLKKTFLSISLIVTILAFSLVLIPKSILTDLAIQDRIFYYELLGISVLTYLIIAVSNWNIIKKKTDKFLIGILAVCATHFLSIGITYAFLLTSIMLFSVGKKEEGENLFSYFCSSSNMSLEYVLCKTNEGNEKIFDVEKTSCRLEKIYGHNSRQLAAACLELSAQADLYHHNFKESQMLAQKAFNIYKERKEYGDALWALSQAAVMQALNHDNRSMDFNFQIAVDLIKKCPTSVQVNPSIGNLIAAAEISKNSDFLLKLKHLQVK